MIVRPAHASRDTPQATPLVCYQMVDWETIGPAKHRGKFGFWRRIYQMWWHRKFPYIKIDMSGPQWENAACEDEMRQFCSRRR